MTITLDEIILSVGSHQGLQEGACLLEAASYIARESWTDHPACVSPVLGAYGRALNDALPDDRRQELKPYIPRLIGTANDGQDETRSYIALDWLIRTYTPAFLDLAGLTAEAQQLRSLRRIVDMVAAKAAGPVVRSARERAAAVRGAAGGAAWDAAGDAVRGAAGDAAWAAAWDAAGAAVRGAAGDAAGGAAWGAALDAARGAARGAVGDAVRDAVRGALKPTVDVLQTSAIALLDTLIDPKAAV